MSAAGSARPSTSTPSPRPIRTSSTTGRRSSRRHMAKLPRAAGRRRPTSRSPRRTSPSTSTATPPRGSACRSRQIDQTLYDAFGQRQVATIYTSSTQYKVVLEVAAASSRRIRPRCRASTSPAPNGAQVPLSTVAQLHQQDRAAHRQPPGPVPRRHPLLQPGAGRGARPGGRADPADAGRPQDADHAATAPSRARRRPSSRRCHRRRSWSPPRSSPSTSCWACSTRATSIPSPSCRPCRRPASARCWR